MIAHGMKPVFVFDGKPPEMKMEEVLFNQVIPGIDFLKVSQEKSKT